MEIDSQGEQIFEKFDNRLRPLYAEKFNCGEYCRVCAVEYTYTSLDLLVCMCEVLCWRRIGATGHASEAQRARMIIRNS